MTDTITVAIIASGGGVIASIIAGLAAKYRQEKLMVKVQEIHVLVNNRLDAALLRISQLEELLNVELSLKEKQIDVS